MKINSKEYWENRFESDWLEYGGDKQTLFFGNILCSLLPETLIREIRSNDYSVCDLGCAEGQAVRLFTRLLGVQVDGMDFSEEAINIARQNSADMNNTFWVGDLTNLDQKHTYDVTICSNVLEHFTNPWRIAKNISTISGKYMILMFPYRETLQIKEHEYIFTENNIPITVNDFVLQFVQTVDGKTIENSYYPDQQILLIYKKSTAEDRHLVMLNDICGGFWDSMKDAHEKLQSEHEKDRLELSRKNEQISALENELSALKAEYSKEVSRRTNADTEYADIKRRLEEAYDLCYRINGRTSYKILTALARFERQFLFGSLAEKRKFLSICKNAITGRKSEFTGNDGYNMVLNIANVLHRPAIENKMSTDNSILAESGRSDNSQGLLSDNLKSILMEQYDKPDVLIFSVIDYDFRYQRPQHFAARFAQNGQRVFYINANFIHQDSVLKKSDNLYVVNWNNEKCNAVYSATDYKKFDNWLVKRAEELIYEYGISDAVMVIDYPNWINGIKVLREKFGFKIVADYMDDFTGFLGTTTNALKENCLEMLRSSDLTVASSNFLHDIAVKYSSNVAIVRNGTETEHFRKAIDMRTENKRPVIGYYGAVSHWFAWDKVCYLAEKLPDCDLMIIGEVTDYRKELEKYDNIKLLGEKKYQELPGYLAQFDVCLIPFDTSTDLIKATNPVKFYEYLSAGKKIVATEIPELEPYKDEYVYMSNDNETFLQYVKQCLEGNDDLMSADDCIRLAEENDWQKRYESFSEACLSAFPKVSVIVLTYNNLELNKACIKSILDKTAYPNYELLIVDNMSTDGTVEYLRELEAEAHPQVHVIYNDKNSGFAGGNNLAIQRAEGDFIVLLNNDTVVTRGWLTNGVKHMVNDTKCGMCGAVTNSIGNEAMIKVDYHNLSELEGFAYYYTRKHNGECYRDMDRLAMFCTFIRRQIIDEHGGLDENYQVGMFEDDDFAMTVVRAGYHIYAVEDVFVHHVNNASFKKIESEEYKNIFEKNKHYFESKWNVKWKMPKYRKGVSVDINHGMMAEPHE